MDDATGETLFATAEEEGMRLDLFLARRYEEGLSRNYFQQLIEAGAVLLNGKRCKKRHKIACADQVSVIFLITRELTLEPQAIPLQIIYEDEHLIAVDKPPGMVVHPAPGNWSGTFVNALLYHCKNLLETSSDNVRPGIVHRLDKETSGLLVAAKTAIAHQKLVELFMQRKVYKSYLAICCGAPGTGCVDLAIGRHPVERKKMAVLDCGGKEAITVYETLARDGELSLLSVEIKTGRTHQIRVHMAHLGAPVLGDSTYGNSTKNRKYSAKRQLLHAHKLAFTHPISGEPLALTAPIPDDMRRFSTLFRL